MDPNELVDVTIAIAALPDCDVCRSEGRGRSPAKYSAEGVSLCLACARVKYQSALGQGKNVYKLISVLPAAKGLIPKSDPTIELR